MQWFSRLSPVLMRCLAHWRVQVPQVIPVPCATFLGPADINTSYSGQCQAQGWVPAPGSLLRQAFRSFCFSDIELSQKVQGDPSMTKAAKVGGWTYSGTTLFQLVDRLRITPQPPTLQRNTSEVRSSKFFRRFQQDPLGPQCPQ